MLSNLKLLLGDCKTLAVAVSGGSDSMALLHFAINNAEKLGLKVVAINVEHGIRGKSSENDSLFVQKFCNENNVPLISYKIDSINFAKENHLSIEESARILRYKCFYEALNQGKCDKIATAHHLSDNVESVLFNLFRGSGTKGLAGINKTFADRIIRPFLNVEKKQILEYVAENAIPYVTDETNLCTDYTRNAIRLNIIPEILKVFPDAEKCIARLSEIVEQEDQFLDDLANQSVCKKQEKVYIKLPLHSVLLSRATITALKLVGIKKDWEKKHIDAVIELSGNQTGKKINLLNGVCVIKEYDSLVFYKEPTPTTESELAFCLGEHDFNGQKLNVAFVNEKDLDLKIGLYADYDKIPQDAVIRTRQNGDIFTKFGGGTKPLSDFFTEKKIPRLERDCYPLLANGKTILAIFGLAVSEKIKVDSSTLKIIKFTKE